MADVTTWGDPKIIQKRLSDLSSQAQSLDGSGSDIEYHRRQDLLQDVKQLVRDLSTPEETVFNQMLTVAELTAIRTLLNFDVFSHFPKDGSCITLDQLSQTTGVQASLLERLLRTLALTRFVEQIDGEGGPYKHAKMSEAFASEFGPSYMFKSMTDEYAKFMIRFDEYLEVRGKPYVEPNGIGNTPYAWYHKREGESVWDIMSSFPDRMKTFQNALAAWDKSVPVVGSHYDYSKLKTDDLDRMELVDVGGGHGRVLKEILDHTPVLSSKNCVLQEKPQVIQLAKDISGLPSDVVYMVHDFMQEQPVKGARAYHMRFITHDYSDENNIKIISNIAAAMAPDSLLLIAEMVLPINITEEDLLGVISDNVMLDVGGKERTEAAFRRVLEASGLEIVHVYRTSRGPGGIIEARLKPQS